MTHTDTHRHITNALLKLGAIIIVLLITVAFITYDATNLVTGR